MKAPAGILLTGGIGSGKSTVAGIFAALGAVVVSADEAAHRVLAPGGAAAGPVARRWPQVVVDGEIDRGRLAAVVFEDRQALAELEALTHPAIRGAIREEIDAARGPLVVVEVPLLVDPVGLGWPLVVVDAPEPLRRERLRQRGMEPGDVDRRMAAQPSRSDWLDAADHVIDNSGDVEALTAACRRLWDLLVGG